MSIRALALELYRAKKKLEATRARLASCGPEEETGLRQELRLAEREHDMLKKMLEGEKEAGKSRMKFKDFTTFKR